MDEEKCAEVALEYMKSKYGKEFVLVDSSEQMRINGPAGYTKVEVKNAEDENTYLVLVYPQVDKNGHYASYKVTMDNYMNELVTLDIKNELDKILEKAGIKDFLSKISVGQITKEGDGFKGFFADFKEVNENELNLVQLLKKYDLYISCTLEIPESVYNNSIQERIEKEIMPLISNDTFSINMIVYSEETFIQRKLLYQNELVYKEDGKNILVGIENINFIIQEDSNNEY